MSAMVTTAPWLPAALENGDIAIIGMAGLYPQADDVDVFWGHVLSKKDCVTESPEGRARIGDGRFKVVGAICDITTGQVRLLP